MKTKLVIWAITFSTRISVVLLSILTIGLATVEPARADFTPGNFFGCADTSVLAPVAPFTKQVSGWAIGAGIIFMGILVIMAGIKIGAARDDVGKAQAGAAALKHVLIGVGVLLFVIPLFFLIVAKANVFCH